MTVAQVADAADKGIDAIERIAARGGKLLEGRGRHTLVVRKGCWPAIPESRHSEPCDISVCI